MRRQHASDLIIGRQRQGPELGRRFMALEEDAVEEQRVKMDVGFSPPPKRWITVSEPDRQARMP